MTERGPARTFGAVMDAHRTERLDRPRAVGLKARAVVAAILLAAAVPAPALAADSGAYGAQLPPGATRLEPGRFEAGMSWQATLKWFDKQYPKAKYPRIEIVNRPGLRAVHLQNSAAGEWEGLNLYEYKGRVKIFVLERVAGR